MLVLSRKKGESLVIGQNIHVKVLEIGSNRVKLGFDCPAEVAVHRQEVSDRIGGVPPLATHRGCS